MLVGTWFRRVFFPEWFSVLTLWFLGIGLAMCTSVGIDALGNSRSDPQFFAGFNDFVETWGPLPAVILCVLHVLVASLLYTTSRKQLARDLARICGIIGSFIIYYWPLRSLFQTIHDNTDHDPSGHTLVYCLSAILTQTETKFVTESPPSIAILVVAQAYSWLGFCQCIVTAMFYHPPVEVLGGAVGAAISASFFLATAYWNVRSNDWISTPYGDFQVSKMPKPRIE